MSRKGQYLILVSSFILCVLALSFIPPISQDKGYHSFADQHSHFGIPHFWNVISNIPFLFVGLYGLVKQKAAWAPKFMFLTLNIGFVLTALGSSYYHFNPTNTTLVWDRLPMTMIFMSFFSISIYQLLNKRLARILFPILLSFGVLSVWYWDFSERIGEGDLRPYVLVQFYPILILPFLIITNWKYLKRGKALIGVLLFYGLAKVFETSPVDWFFLEKVGMLSGHSLKHLFAAGAGFFILQWTMTRKVEPVEQITS